jgi:SAM-dependent methyltransferase
LYLDKNYWNNRWENSETGWDIGYASPAIVCYMQQVPRKDIAILIPGCGNAYEAAYLVEQGFINITLIDIAPEAVNRLKAKFIDFPQVNVLCEDFFEHQGQYDLVIEQTFFCAISPDRRPDYARKMADLLKNSGKIIGLLFNINFEKQGPPFGGSVSEYETTFTPCFDIKTMALCHNSIPPRKNSEVFIILNKKQATLC